MGPCTGFDSGLFFSGAGLLNGLTIAIAFPLNVFLKERATLLLLDAEDFVDFESESESESAGLLFDSLVGSRIGCGLSTSPTRSSSFCCCCEASGNVDTILALSKPLDCVSLKEVFEVS